MESYVIGKCQDMCPDEEVKLRERERLLHVLEVIPGTEKDRMPKADRSRMVKTFCRSAAGKSMQDPRNLRPPNVLLKTLNYLLDDVISRSDLPWPVIYDFVMDRLRSVRQDLVIQNASKAHCICILQPIVKFHAYASYRDIPGIYDDQALQAACMPLELNISKTPLLNLSSYQGHPAYMFRLDGLR